MPCGYCDADVDGGCRGMASASDCLREQLQSADAQRAKLRRALGNPFLTGHSGCEGGPFLKLKYYTNAQALRAHKALAKLLRDPA